MSETDNTTERWSADHVRDDGLRVYCIDNETWIITTARGASVEICPCCGLPFETPRAARLVADQIFPMEKLGGAQANG